MTWEIQKAKKEFELFCQQQKTEMLAEMERKRKWPRVEPAILYPPPPSWRKWWQGDWHESSAQVETMGSVLLTLAPKVEIFVQEAVQGNIHENCANCGGIRAESWKAGG